MPFGTVISQYLGSHFTELKKSEIVGGTFFSSSENGIWSILLKYQGIDVQIQAFTDENWNTLHSYFFERY